MIKTIGVIMLICVAPINAMVVKKVAVKDTMALCGSDGCNGDHGDDRRKE